MMKAASLPVGLMFLLATAPAAWSQAPADETAINEAVYRQANRVTLRKKLVEARAAQQRHAPVAAAKLYDEAWDLVQKIGSGVEAAHKVGTASRSASRRTRYMRWGYLQRPGEVKGGTNLRYSMPVALPRRIHQNRALCLLRQARR